MVNNFILILQFILIYNFGVISNDNPRWFVGKYKANIIEKYTFGVTYYHDSIILETFMETKGQVFFCSPFGEKDFNLNKHIFLRSYGDTFDYIGNNSLHNSEIIISNGKWNLIIDDKKRVLLNEKISINELIAKKNAALNTVLFYYPQYILNDTILLNEEDKLHILKIIRDSVTNINSNVMDTSSYNRYLNNRFLNKN